MKEFKVNKYLSLKLENNQTNIYVNNKRFNQCRRLLIDIPVSEMKSLEEITSIDELEEKIEKSEKSKKKIPEDAEFWGHSSNLQVWTESNYDTRLLHRNIAFPLLRKLSDVGDPIAQKVFQEEIIKRLESNYRPVIKFLVLGRYLNYFDESQIKELYQRPTLNLLDIFLNCIDHPHSIPYNDAFYKPLRSISEEQFYNRVLKWFQYRDPEIKITLIRAGFFEGFKDKYKKAFIDDNLIETLLSGFKSSRFRHPNTTATRALQNLFEYLPDKYKDRIIHDLPDRDFEAFIDLLNGGIFSKKPLLDFVNENQKNNIMKILNEKLINWYSQNALKKSIYSREKEHDAYILIQALGFASENLKSDVLTWMKTIKFTDSLLLFQKGVLGVFDKDMVDSFLLDPDYNFFHKLTRHLEKRDIYHLTKAFKNIINYIPEDLIVRLKHWFLKLPIDKFSSFTRNGFLDFLSSDEKQELLRDQEFNYIPNIIKELEKEDASVIIRSFNIVSQYLSDRQKETLIDWIKKIDIEKLIYLMGNEFFSFLLEGEFETLISSISQEILEKILADLNKNISTAKTALKQIAEAAPIILIKTFEECFKTSDIEKLLKIIDSGVFYRLKIDKLQVITNDPRSHFFEILLNILDHDDPHIKSKASYMLENLGQGGLNYVNSKLDTIIGEEKLQFLYNLMQGGYFAYNDHKVQITSLIDQINKEISQNSVIFMFNLFITQWKSSNFDPEFLYRSYLFKTLNQIKGSIEEEILELLTTQKNDLLYFHLFSENILDFLPSAEIHELFSDFDIKEFVRKFMYYIDFVEEGETIDWLIGKFGKLGKFGLKVLLQLLNEKFDYMEMDTIAYPIKEIAEENEDLAKKEIIEFIINKSYEEIRDLFNFEVIKILDKKDVVQIYKNPNSHLLDKLKKASEEEYPPWYIEGFLSKLGKAGGDIIFKMTQSRDYLDHMKGIFKEMGEDIIEPFIKHVLINENNYRYGDWGYEFINIFFDIFTQDQIKAIIENKEYNIINRLLEKYNPSDRWANHGIEDFFYIAFQNLDQEYIIKINNMLPDSLKQEILQIYEESAYHSSSRYASPEQIMRSQKAKKLVELLKSKIYQINDNISLRLENEKTILYIKDRRFTQCMQLLLNIPIKEIPDYDGIESVDEASEIYSNTERDHVSTEISPEEEFWAHCSNIQAWVENNYDTRLLHSNIAFPLLKKLADQGVIKAKNLFKEEVAKRLLNGNYSVITYLWNQRYLSNFTEEELKTLFEDFDFAKLSKWKEKERNNWLKKLIDKGIKGARTFFKDHIISLIEAKDWKTFSDILKPYHHGVSLKIFTTEELEIIFRDFDYISFLSSEKERRLIDLKLLSSLGISKAKEIFKQEIRKILLNGNVRDVNNLFSNNYLDVFEEEEIDNLLKRFDFQRILNYEYTSLSILRGISKYNKSLAKNYIKEEIEKQFYRGNYKQINTIVNKHYLHDFFTEEEQKSIVKKINFDNLKKDGSHSFLNLLTRLNHLVPVIYKRELENIFLSEGSNTIKLILERNYLKVFSKEELIAIFKEFDFNKVDLSLLKELTKLGVPRVINKFRERRACSDKLADLKKEIISKFETGDYKSLNEMFRKHRYGDTFRDSRLNDLIQEDFEEIFEALNKSDTFKKSFEFSLQKQDPPFSIPIKVIASNIEQTVNTARELFNELASKIFTNSPLNIIAFLSRPEYLKFFEEKEFTEIFSFKNEHIKSEIIKALKEDISAPLPLIVLKKLVDSGDKDAKSYLKENLVRLISTSSYSVIRFLNDDGFLNYLEDLDTELQLYIAFSPDLDYSKIFPKLKSPALVDLVDKDIQESFMKTVNKLQEKERIWIREDELEPFKDAILSFGIDAFKGLTVLYLRDSRSLQVLAVECILKLYRTHKNIVTHDTKQKLGHFFHESFKPYYKLFKDEIQAVEEYGKLLLEYKKEYNELKFARFH
ncbi:MAG: hypothetical protein CEE43_17405 [Promethearchaeota archaeon Loki_b32]|nr:MAG: hypothetical protein CEE43_17405 [Candidatus Lokiarchaeota archaeon Loki_b32]